MRFRFPVLFLLLAPPLCAEPALRDVAAYRQGREALESKLWEIASDKFGEALKTPGLSPAEQLQLEFLEIEAWIRGDRPADALAKLSKPPLSESPDAPFWKAQALAGLGRYRDAVEALDRSVSDPKSGHRTEALLTRASLQLSLGQPEAALESLQPLTSDKDPKIVRLAKLRQAAILADLGRIAEARALLPPVTPDTPASDASERAFLDARLQLAEGKAAEAATAFTMLLDKPEGQSLLRFHSAALGLADALAVTDGTTAAADSLLAFVQKYPDSPLLDEIFKRLQSYIPDDPAPNDAILERLAQWSSELPPPAVGLLPRAPDGNGDGSGDGAAGAFPVEPEKPPGELAAFATFTRAIGLHRQESPDAKAKATRLLTRLRLDYPDHFLAAKALLQLGRWALEEHRPDRAFSALEAARLTSSSPFVRGEAAFLEARAAYDGGDAEKAAKLFDVAAESLDREAGEIAAFNAALSRFSANPSLGLHPSGATEQDVRVRTDLELERALSTVSPESARESIARFLNEHPEHPRANEARLAAAEAALVSHPPDPVSAGEQLDLIASQEEGSAENPATEPLPPERLELVRLKIADVANKPNEAIPLARAFLAAHPDSPLAAEASLILGRNLFRNEDYNNARIVLEKLAASRPEDPSSPAALLLAARSAALVGTSQSQEESLALFNRVATGKSALAPLARLERARLLIDRKRLDEAVAELKPWFDSLPADDPLRLPAGLLLGEALYAQGEAKAGSYSAALAVYDQLLAAAKEQPAMWNRVQYQRGMTLEQLPKDDDSGKKREGAALATYYSVLQNANDRPPAEWEWFERCGFRALALLEKDGKWEAAVEIANKIASFKGPGSAYAAERAQKLRLDHRIWED